MREIKIEALSPEDLAEVMNSVDIRQFNMAIGYFSSWAIAGGTFPRVNIWVSRDCEIIARYYKQDSILGYAIVGVWDADSRTYSFHS